MHEVGGFLEASVYARKPDKRDLINLPQPRHDALADVRTGHLPVVFVRNFVDDSLQQILDDLRADGALLEGFFQTGRQLFPGKLLAPAVALDHHKPLPFNFFVGGEAMPATDALSATANSRSLARRARVNHLVILTTAFRTTHSRNRTTAGSGMC